MSDRTELQTLKRKVRRLENKNAELEAEVSVCQMMIHDFAAEDVIKYVERKYPALAKRWEAA